MYKVAFSKFVCSAAAAILSLSFSAAVAHATSLFVDQPPVNGGTTVVADNSVFGLAYDKFNLGSGQSVIIDNVTWWGNLLSGTDSELDFRLSFIEANGMALGTTVFDSGLLKANVDVTITATALTDDFLVPVKKYSVDFANGPVLDGSADYFLSVDHNGSGLDPFLWSISDVGSNSSFVGDTTFTTFGRAMDLTGGPLDGFAYQISGTVVPIPASGLMVLPVLAAGALVARRRCQA